MTPDLPRVLRGLELRKGHVRLLAHSACPKPAHRGEEWSDDPSNSTWVRIHTNVWTNEAPLAHVFLKGMPSFEQSGEKFS